MHSTKTEILTLLKRADGRTVDDLSSALGLASMTVRQHLVALERDSLVRAEEVRRATGRPHFRYRLTDDGHRALADGYDRLVSLLVEQAAALQPEELLGEPPEARPTLLVRRAARALVSRHRADLNGPGERERMERLTELLRSYGGFAEWHEVDGGYEVRDFNCIMREHAGRGSCAWHETLLREAFGNTVLAAGAPEDGCAACCRYIVPAAVPVSNRG